MLSPIPSSLRTDLEIQVQLAADAVEKLVVEGLLAAQNRFNS